MFLSTLKKKAQVDLPEVKKNECSAETYRLENAKGIKKV